MNKNAISEVRLQLDTMIGQFAAVLPRHIPVERFGRVVLTAVQTNPVLSNVERRSLWNACMKAAQDGLMPDGRFRCAGGVQGQAPRSDRAVDADDCRRAAKGSQLGRGCDLGRS